MERQVEYIIICRWGIPTGSFVWRNEDEYNHQIVSGEKDENSQREIGGIKVMQELKYMGVKLTKERSTDIGVHVQDWERKKVRFLDTVCAEKTKLLREYLEKSSIACFSVGDASDRNKQKRIERSRK